MPNVVIYSGMKEHHILLLDKKIKNALFKIKELELGNRSWTTVLLVPARAVDNPCVVHITLDKKLRRTKTVLDQAAKTVHDILKEHANFSMIEVLTFPFRKETSGCIKTVIKDLKRPVEKINTHA